MGKEHSPVSEHEEQVTKIIVTLQNWIDKYAKKHHIIDPLIFLDAFHEFELVVEQECVGQGVSKDKIDLIKRNAGERFEIKHKRMLEGGDFI
ncbi:MAG: hypothetical protein WBP64_11550 [Nitrososphaeraceae archaeon]|jgi:hypothetical protein